MFPSTQWEGFQDTCLGGHDPQCVVLSWSAPHISHEINFPTAKPQEINGLWLFQVGFIFHSAWCFTIKKMNLDPGWSSYVWNMISLVSRLIYNYNSKPPLPPRDYLPLCVSESGEPLSWLQESLSWKPDFFFFSYIFWTNSAIRSLEPDIVVDLQLGQGSLLTKTNSDLLPLKANDPWFLRSL